MSKTYERESPITGVLQAVDRKTSGNGNTYIKFNLVSRYTIKDDNYEETFPCIAFSKTIEKAENEGFIFEDGIEVEAVVRLTSDEYNGRYYVKLVLKSIEVAAGKVQEGAIEPDPTSEPSLDGEDDLPF